MSFRHAASRLKTVLAALLVAGSVAAALAGVSVLRAARDGGPAAASAGSGGLVVVPSRATWAGMDSHAMDSGGGYQMPGQMMPGAPEGDDMRLSVPMTLTNTSDGSRRFDLAAEFSLAGGGTEDPVPLHADTFGTLARLGPASSVTGTLYFDTRPPGAGDPPLYLIWRRDGRSQRLAVPLTDSPDTHSHGS